jgi:polysaccharide pyruvyl transferase WcaK-like protein
MRIGLFGNFGSGSFGNDASLSSMLDLLRRSHPGADLICICTRPEPVRADFGLRAVPISAPQSGPRRKLDNWVHAVRTLRGLDVLLLPGTGVLSDYCQGPSGRPYALFRWCLAARLCRVPLVFVSIGAGPIDHPLSRWLMKSAVAMARYRSYRDIVSRDFATRIGVRTENDPICPDIAFLLPVPPSVPMPAPAARRGAAGRPTVGVGVMAYNGWYGQLRHDDDIYRTYLARTADFVVRLLRDGYGVRLLMGDLADRRPVDDLLRIVAADAAAAAVAERLVFEPAAAFPDAIGQIGQTDIVVSARFHHLVFALTLGRPVLAIGYNTNHAALLAEMGLEEFSQHIERLDVDRLMRQVDALLRDRAASEARIGARVASCRARLGHQHDQISRRFLAPSPTTLASNALARAGR